MARAGSRVEASRRNDGADGSAASPPTRAVPLRHRASASLRYAVAVASVAAALLALWWMSAISAAPAHVSLFLCATMLSAWFGGFGPGLLTLALCTATFEVFFLSPHGAQPDLAQLPRLAMLVLSGLFVTTLTASQRRTAMSLAQARDDLHERSRELERMHTTLQEEDEERRRTDYLINQVFDSVPDGVAIMGADYRYKRVNATYETYFDVPTGTLVGTHLAELVGAAVFEVTRGFVDRCVAGEEVHNAGWWIRDPLERRYMAVTYTPLRPHGGRVEAALVISRDLTEHIRASEALREAQAALAQVTRVATLGEVTASFAHELNQPLAAIVNNANACLALLERDRSDVDDVRGALGDIAGDALRASAIIERVRVLATRSAPEQAPLTLGDVVDDIVALAAAESRERRVAIRSDVSADVPIVLGDRVQLQQVVLNMVVNGMDAMSMLAPSERRLEIIARADSQDGAAAARLSVRDCGSGLDGANADRLFQAFFTTKPHGMGLGLAISRSIIESHGGRLWAEANQGPGATFSFTLPAAPAAEMP